MMKRITNDVDNPHKSQTSPSDSNKRKALKRADGRELNFGWEEVGKERRKVSLLREEIAFGGHFLRMGRGMAGEGRRLSATRKH